jgi:flagellar protein FliJ
MRSRETLIRLKRLQVLIRLKRFQVNENRRKVAQIEGMIAEFERNATELEREIKTHDPTHYAYPSYAKAATQRRENLKRSADEFKIQLEDAKVALDEAFAEMQKVELLDERDQMHERAQQDAGKQDELDADLMRNSVRV